MDEMYVMPIEGLNEESENDIQEHWSGMPEYSNMFQADALITATFKFRNREDYDEFHALVKKYIYGGEKVFDGMQREEAKQAWFPLKEKASNYECR